MEKPQETMGERFVAKFGTIKHRGFPQTAIMSFVREEITRAIEAHDRELAEKVSEMDVTDTNSWDYNMGAGDMKNEVLALLTKQ